MFFEPLSIVVGVFLSLTFFLFLWLPLRTRFHEAQEQCAFLLNEAQKASLEKIEALTRAERLPGVEKKLEETRQFLQAAEQKYQTMEVLIQSERRAMVEQKELLVAAEKKLSDTFKAISVDVMDSNNKVFLNLAQQTFKNLQDKSIQDLAGREKAIHELVNPVKESLAGVATKLSELETARVSAYEVLKHQVTDLISSQKELRLETANLVKALRAPAVRGRWGEMQLKRVVEMTGLSSHCDFVEQQTMHTGENILRPDMVVKLPGGKQIVIDAKAPLSAYLEALEATDDFTRREKLRDHARQVKTHILALSSKAYWDQFPANTSPEFVILFLPGETFFSAALEHDPTLIELGVEKKVILTTPSTLIALLHAVAYGWRQEALTANAQEISELGRDLYKRLSDMGKHFGKLGKDLNLAVRSYNDTVGSLERRVLPSARRFKDLEASSSRDEILEIPQLEMIPRDLQAPELVINS
ncbi:MAG: DNA recombination protein RmuC [Alphaproteobacteria bacterium]|nr:DNA recombination protein RmuC [Alphaproteobacteria bacterium]